MTMSKGKSESYYEIYRGIPISNLQAVRSMYTKGAEIPYFNFCNGTTNIEAKTYAAGNGIIFRMKVIDCEPAYPNSTEIILFSNCRLFVDSECELSSDGFYYVGLSEKWEDLF